MFKSCLDRVFTSSNHVKPFQANTLLYFNFLQAFCDNSHRIQGNTEAKWSIDFKWAKPYLNFGVSAA